MKRAGLITVKFLRWLAVNLAVCVLLLLLIEGIAGFLVAWRTLKKPYQAPEQGVVAERLHTEYDPLLGWINLPGIVITNMYGSGRNLKINRQRFRDNNDLTALTSGERRIVISGDSFAFGYGVGNDDAWGTVLESMLDGVDVVNMGQGGYGLGQAYLWYKRDGDSLPHDLHVMAFITEDYRRMVRPRFMGYGKPALTARDGRMEVENTPVPRYRLGAEPWAPLLPALEQLRVCQFVMRRSEAMRKERDEVRQAQTQATAALLFADLFGMHQASGRIGVLVHLPVENDYHGTDSDQWRQWLRVESELNGWIFLDLVEDFRSMPAGQIKSLFIQDDVGRYRGARGHYTELGNQLVAQSLLSKFAENPAIAEYLGL